VLARRPHPLALLAALALVLAVAFGTATGASATPPPAAPGFVGITSQDTFVGDSAYQDAQLSMMKAAGITIIRQVFDWATIETSPGVYDFSPYNQLVTNAAAYGIQIMPVFYDEPAFLSSRPKKAHNIFNYPPKKMGTIAALAQAAVSYYGPNGTFWQDNPTVPAEPIRIWQIWDEPNLNFFWYPHASAKNYVKMLCAASKAIHSVDKGAEVVSAGMPLSTDGVNLYKFVRQMLGAGAGPCMNTLAVNAYSAKASGVIKILTKVRAVLNAGGASADGIRVSEVGWSDVGPKSAFRAGVTGQASEIASVIGDFGVARSTLDLRGFVYFDWRDTPPYKGVKNFWGLHTGLLKLNGVVKPALAAFTTAVDAL
jgi:hypothetical protein